MRRAGPSDSWVSDEIAPSASLSSTSFRGPRRQRRERGHSVEIVGNGREALVALEYETFDVLLMDVQMPEMGGFEATAAIRERERPSGRHTRVVAMTADAMSGDRERCLAAGMDTYLAKPITPEALFTVVEQGAPSQPSLDSDSEQ